jgi:hypothetical protein
VPDLPAITPSHTQFVAERVPRRTDSVATDSSRGDALFAAVRTAHRQLTQHQFVRTASAAGLALPNYLAYLADQNLMVTTLHRALSSYQHDPVLGPLVLDAVTNRQGRAALDAAAVGAHLPPPGAAACRLAAHIGTLADDAAVHSLAVHAWVQYMAMLNGGDRLRRAFCEQFGSSRLLRFEPDAATCRAAYAAAFEAATAGEHDVEAVYIEARAAFEAHIAMLDDATAAAESATEATSSPSAQGQAPAGGLQD